MRSPLPRLLAFLLGLPCAALAAEDATLLGVNDHILYRTPAEHTAAFNVYRDSDTRYLRVNIDWITLEPSPGVYSTTRLANLDRFFALAATSRIRVLASLAYAPAWANGGHQGGGWPPADNANYADFCEWFARRYAGYMNQDGKRVLEAVELWNEPDLCDLFFKGWPRYSPDAALAYAGMVKVAGQRLREVRTALGAPDLLICAPAISNLHGVQWAPKGKTSWIDAFYAVPGVTGCYDVVTLHSYWESSGSTGWLPPELPACWAPGHQQAAVMGRIYDREADGRSLWDRMKAAGDGTKEIWLTEIGGSAREDQPAHKERLLSLSEQKAHLEDVIAVLRSGRIENLRRVYWYELFDEPHAQREQRYFGLLALRDHLPPDYSGPISLTDATLTPKPAYGVYRDTAKSATERASQPGTSPTHPPAGKEPGKP